MISSTYTFAQKDIFNPINKSIRGFSLIEMSIALGVMAILACAIIPSFIRSLEIKAAEKTALEITMIQQASLNYYSDTNQWPEDVSTLTTKGYLNSQWVAHNPWNNPYQISHSAFNLTVTTETPSYLSRLMAGRLPESVVDGTKVSSTISTLGFGSALKRGMILAWSGAIGQIPQGWALCDGTNGTPDLRDRFIVGARVDLDSNAVTNILGSLQVTGGSVSHNHGGQSGEHQLSIDEMPSHHHAGYGEAFPEKAPFGAAGEYGRGYIGDGHSDYDNYLYNTSSAGGNKAHAHSISADNHIPPFYALAYIMKL